MRSNVALRPPGWPEHLATPGVVVAGVTHRADPVPGWRCECGQLRLPMVLPGEKLTGHTVVEDDVTPADPAACPRYLARFRQVTDVGFAAVLGRADLTGELVDRLVVWAVDTGDNVTRVHRSVRLLRSAVPLRPDHVATLVTDDRHGVDLSGVVEAALEHPACTMDVVAGVVDAPYDRLGECRWVTAVDLAALLERHPQRRVRAAAALRRRGVGMWEIDHRMNGPAVFRQAVVDLDARFGDDGWRVVERLVPTWTGTGAQLLTTVEGIVRVAG